jgi:hypothetical protein
MVTGSSFHSIILASLHSSIVPIASAGLHTTITINFTCILYNSKTLLLTGQQNQQ